MKSLELARLALIAFIVITLLAIVQSVTFGDEDGGKEKPAASDDKAFRVSTDRAATTGSNSSSLPPYSKVLEGAEETSGLLKLHQKGTKLYAELSSANLNKDYIVLISIARGMGETPLIGGMTWSMGDDWLWQFRHVDDRIQVVRRNVRFKAAKGSPEEKAVKLAYTDSVLFSLPVATKSSSGAYVVDLSPVLMSDLPQISQVLRGFSFSRDKSTWASIKGFEDNMEIEVAATYASSGSLEFDTVADSRGVSINIHYSISRLPSTGYKPRVADDRVGYFVTALKDYSKKSRNDRFLRYINRWDLQKADSSAELSPPKKPIIFWLEKTVPFKYRKPIREGILEWNKAFEKAGFANAIEVRQQPDDADWEPEDINYNTFRWITSSAGFAMGPSRVNPTTGQILDADIIFDADFLQYWRMEYETYTPESLAAITGRHANHEQRDPLQDFFPGDSQRRYHGGCDQCRGMASQYAFGAILLEAKDGEASKEDLDRMILQGLKETVMHEVGHTLGMRHNFKASSYLTLEEIADPAKTAKTGLAASVMDYLPVNFAAKDEEQGDYFSQTIGPYDYWVIEYGYKPFSSSSEAADLKKIASRAAEPELTYATDSDVRGYDPDPLVNRFDLGKDPIAYARQRTEVINSLFDNLIDQMTEEGEGYQGVRRAFNILLSMKGSAMHFAARFIGGLYAHRDHRGDPDGRPPFVVVEPKKQREALALLEKEVFAPDAYEFPPNLYNHLAPSKWNHWGVEHLTRADYPVHEIILNWQDQVLSELLSSMTLSRLLDSELKVPTGQDAFTAAELLERLTGSIFQETEKLNNGKFSNRKPAILSLRRSLQRKYLERLANLAMGNTMAPDDCQAVAYLELDALEARIRRVLSGKAQLDTYTRAHLTESAERIRKIREARFQLSRP